MLKERHPYIIAQDKFTRGLIPVAQAVGMILSDREFIAECEMTGRPKALHAEAIVRGPWSDQLIANVRASRALEEA